MARRELAIEVKVSKVQEIAKLTASLKELRKEQRELTAQLAKKEKVSKAEAASFDTRFKQINKESEALRRRKKELKDNIAASTKATKSSNGMAKQFIKGAAAVGIVVTAFRRLNNLVSGMITTFTEFEFTMAKVNAVSGASETQFKQLSDTAEELGRTTFFTASQVAELQLNYSKLGFKPEEILAAQKATLDLATVTGSDLARSATVAGAVIRGFGLEASEMTRVVDVMTVAFVNSTLDIEKFNTSMTKIAPIAKAAGFSLEETIAILGSLTDAGIEASIAGTSLRNIFLKMQDPSSDLAKAFGFTVSGLDELIPAMKRFREEGGKLEDVLQVVDQRQVAAFERMLSSSEQIGIFAREMENAEGQSAKMAKIIGDTLQGSFLKFTSALQGLSVKVMKEFAGQLSDNIQRLANFIVELGNSSKQIANIIKVIGRIIRALVLYKTAIIGVNVATRTATAVQKAFAGAVTLSNTVSKGFVATLKLMRGALLRSGIGIAVALLGDLVFRLMDSKEKTEELTDAVSGLDKTLDLINKEAQRFDKIIQQSLGTTINESKENIRGFNKQIDILNGFIKNLSDSTAEGSQAQIQFYNETIERLESRIALEYENIDALERRFFAENDLIGIQKEKLKEAQKMVATTEAELTLKNQTIEAINTEIQRLQDLGKEKQVQFDLDRQLLEFKHQMLMNGTLSEQMAADVRKQLIQQQIADIDKELQHLVISEARRKQLLTDRVKLEESLNAKSTEDNKKKLEEDIVTASLSGQNALESVKSVIRARIMEAVATQISKVISTIPFPANILVAAGAGIAVSRMVDSLLAKIAPAESAGMLGSGGGATAANVSAGTRAIYARGGMVHGKSHAEGGEKFAVGGRVVELEGGEAVINKRSTAMFRNQLSAMNSAGGGVKFADGGLLNMPSFTTAQFDALNSQVNMGQQKVVVVEADITDAQNTVSTIQSEATI